MEPCGRVGTRVRDNLGIHFFKLITQGSGYLCCLVTNCTTSFTAEPLNWVLFMTRPLFEFAD